MTNDRIRLPHVFLGARYDSPKSSRGRDTHICDEEALERALSFVSSKSGGALGSAAEVCHFEPSPNSGWRVRVLTSQNLRRPHAA